MYTPDDNFKNQFFTMYQYWLTYKSFKERVLGMFGKWKSATSTVNEAGYKITSRMYKRPNWGWEHVRWIF